MSVRKTEKRKHNNEIFEQKTTTIFNVNCDAIPFVVVDEAAQLVWTICASSTTMADLPS